MADLKLYYFPTSFFSQKALMALYEKEADFREQKVLFHDGEQNEPWYLRVNPKGTVPALEVGDRVLTDSEDIVEYVDKELDTGVKLIPDPQTQIGKDVQKWRQLFNSIRVEVVTYGIFFHPELSTSGTKIPGFFRKWFAQAMDRMKGGEKILQDGMDQNPEHKKEFLVKLKVQTERLAKMTDKEEVCRHLDNLDNVFDQIEETLANTRKEQGVPDCWLLGPRVTMPDVFLAIFLDRLFVLGLEGRYFPETKRPLVYDYYTRMSKRKSLVNVRKHMNSLPRYFMLRFLKKAFPVVLGVTVLSLGVAVAYRKLNR